MRSMGLRVETARRAQSAKRALHASPKFAIASNSQAQSRATRRGKSRLLPTRACLFSHTATNFDDLHADPLFPSYALKAARIRVGCWLLGRLGGVMFRFRGANVA